MSERRRRYEGPAGSGPSLADWLAGPWLEQAAALAPGPPDAGFVARLRDLLARGAWLPWPPGPRGLWPEDRVVHAALAAYLERWAPCRAEGPAEGVASSAPEHDVLLAQVRDAGLAGGERSGLSRLLARLVRLGAPRSAEPGRGLPAGSPLTALLLEVCEGETTTERTGADCGRRGPRGSLRSGLRGSRRESVAR